MSRPAACGVCIFFCSLGPFQAQAEQIVLNNFVQEFSPTALGGIRKVVRYQQSRPDRMETAIVFLGGTVSGSLPERIEILSQTGDQVQPVDSQGADCALERTAVVHQNGKVAFIDAVRVFDTATMQAGYSAPAPLDLQVYLLEEGGGATESSLVFRASGKPHRTAPLCSSSSVQQAIATVARAIR